MKYDEWIMHFNPNHDSETGRFTNSSGTYLKSGTRLNSVTSVYSNASRYKNNGRWMYTYRDSETRDNKIYKGPFAYFLIQYRGAKFIAEHKYETVKDLKLPTKEQRIEEFKQLKKKSLMKDLESVRKRLIEHNVGSAKEQEDYKNFDVNKIETDHDWAVAYDIFSHAMESSFYYKSTKEYCERMSKKYDAMVDDNNKGVYNNAVDPIIIFRANEALKEISDQPVTKFLTVPEIVRNYESVKNELKKEGKMIRI